MGLASTTVTETRTAKTTDGSFPPAPFEYTDSSWSPDGSQIVFVRSDSGSGSDIWRMDAEGTNLQRLTFTGNNGAPSWAEVPGCPDPTTIDYGGHTAADCAAPQSAVTVFDQAELDAYLTDFGWDGSHVRNVNVKLNPSGEVVIVSPCEVNLAGEGGFLDIVADQVCVYGRKGVTVALDASNPDQGIVAETILLVSEEGNAGFSQGLTLTADEITVQAFKEAKVGLDSVVTVDGPLTLTSTGDLSSSDAIIRQGSDVVAQAVTLSASRGATLGNGTVVSAVGALVLDSTGSAVKSVAAVNEGAVVTADSMTQTSGNKAKVGKDATVEVAGEYEMSADGSCSIAAAAEITAGSTVGSCFE